MRKNTKTLINNRKQLFFLLSSFILLMNCARQIAPVGGPKDIAHPQVVESDPENHTIQFNKKKFQITFDEYIQLKNVNQELLVSPPVIEEPEILLRGKTLLVKFTEDLPDSTTINFNFHNAIADFNEGNIFTDFQYVFSTGHQIDTLFVIGNIRDAFDHTPVDGAFAMFYKNDVDTAPITMLPSFICKSNAEGMFEFRNIPEGAYKIFTLSDANYNMLYDLPTEQIAFLDSLIEPAVELMITTDTIQLEMTENDTIPRDSVFTVIETISKLDTLQLFMFKEYNPIQYLVESSRDEEGKKCTIIFNEGLIKPLVFDPINFQTEENWKIMEENPINDTISFWIADTALARQDTLLFGVEYFTYDSLGETILTTDTIRLTYKKKEEKKERGGLLRRNKEEKDTIVISELTFKTNVDKKNIEFKSDIIIEAKFPVNKVEKSKIHVYYLEDTLETPVEYLFVEDSVNSRKYRLQFPFVDGESYKLFFDTAAYHDIYGNKNDTLVKRFSVREEDYYGNINIMIKGLTDNTILQLLNDKERVLREYIIDSTIEALNIDLLPPEKYNFKLIVDKNNNGKWDTGKYLENLQPEMVYYYNEIITVKSGWDYEIDWDINRTSLREGNASGGNEIEPTEEREGNAYGEEEIEQPIEREVKPSEKKRME